MADFTPEKLDLSKINNGKRFENGDGVGAEAVNAPIEAVAYLDEKMAQLSSATVVTVGGEPVETFDADTKVTSIAPTQTEVGARVYINNTTATGSKDDTRLLTWNEGVLEPTVNTNSAVPMYSNGYVAVRTPDSTKPYAAANVKYVNEKVGTPTEYYLQKYVYDGLNGTRPDNTYVVMTGIAYTGADNNTFDKFASLAIGQFRGSPSGLAERSTFFLHSFQGAKEKAIQWFRAKFADGTTKDVEYTAYSYPYLTDGGSTYELAIFITFSEDITNILDGDGNAITDLSYFRVRVTVR